MKFLNAEEYNEIVLAIVSTKEYQIKHIGSKKEFYYHELKFHYVLTDGERSHHAQ